MQKSACSSSKKAKVKKKVALFHLQLFIIKNISYIEQCRTFTKEGGG